VNWHSLKFEEIWRHLNSTPQGLSSGEVAKRRKEFGANRLPEEKRLSRFYIFINQFKSPLIYILLIAVVICLFLKELSNALVIMAAVFINVIIGFIQEDKAEQSLKKLKTLVEHKAKVLRHGYKREVLAEELVPGDIIIIEAGDKVPADARLIKVYGLEVVEAVLTGESVPSSKKDIILTPETILADRENMIYFGTHVARGRGMAIVVDTGLKTELGNIALMVKEAKNDLTPLQKKMKELAKFLGIVVGILSIFIFLLGWVTGKDFLEMFLISVAVAVAAIPESLMIGVTISLSLGVQRILRKKALVRKLVAAETLGSVTVICTDKTGTLTEGKMAVDQIITQTDKKLFFKIFLLCHNAIVERADNDQQKIIGDSTEEALIRSALEAGLDLKKTEQEFLRLDEVPFDSEKMYMATLHKITNYQLPITNYIFVKGAPEKIIQLSSLFQKADQQIDFNEEEKNKFKKEIENLNKNGLRTMAFAYKKIEQDKLGKGEVADLIFLGLVALKDPIRKDVKKTILGCLTAGIRLILITGDHALTAQKIAEEAGILTIGQRVVEGNELDGLSKEQLREIVKNNSIFARVEPKHKLAIIDALQENGEVVAMTGDGINDAPALKSADIGIALGSGTEVTKEIADIVLLDDNFQTIVSAVEEGRTIFDNIKKIILYLLSGGLSEIILIAGSLMLGLPLPVLPAQILWINIIEDALPAMALTNEKAEKEAMSSYEKGKRNIIDLKMKKLILIIGLTTNFILLGLFWWLYKTTNNLEYARTMVFVGLAIGSLFFIFSCKNLRKTIFQYNPFNNNFLNLSVIFGYLMFFMAIYIPFFQKVLKVVPLQVNDWLILIGFGLFNIIIVEAGKLIFIIKNNKFNVRKKQSI